MSWTASAGLSLIAPFSGLTIEAMEYELRWKCFLLTTLGFFSVISFSWGMIYLPVSTILLLRVRFSPQLTFS